MKIIIILSMLLFVSFKIKANIIYSDPVPDAKFVSINNNIIIGFDQAITSSDLNSLIQVTGTVTGVHTGKVIMTDDKMKLIFKSNKPFAFNENVEVKLNNVKTISKINKKFVFNFQTEVMKLKPDSKEILRKELGLTSGFMQDDPGFATLPSLTVLSSNNPSPGIIYLSSFSFTVNPNGYYLLNSNNAGSYTYTREMDDWTLDYKKQKTGLYTYFKGDKYYGEDKDRILIDSFACGNGYETDFHELVVLNNGHALLMSYDPQPVDMSQIVSGGRVDASVYGLIIQEIDVNKNVVFQWRSWDHIDITDAIHENLTDSIVDYVHGNAIELDKDGNLLISSRHLSEITKISRSTGEIIWRLGGVHNDFTFVNDPIKFSYQHDIRRIDNGNITLYDNGNFHSPPFSRAVEYHLDEVNKVATLVWQYRNSPDIYGFAMGTTQRLHNGNTLIGWGAVGTTLTEVNPAGQIKLEMRLPWPTVSYRVFKDDVNLTLNIKMAIEGFYNESQDILTVRDTVKAYVRSIVSPYNVIDSALSIIDSVNFIGNFRFFNVPTGTYYISLKHRNALETWSKMGGESFTQMGIYQYDFTNSISKAYENNIVLRGSKYCIYSGDVDQDGVIDLSDIGFIGNDMFSFALGYFPTDLNGDGLVDIIDALIADNNVFNSVEKKRP